MHPVENIQGSFPLLVWTNSINYLDNYLDNLQWTRGRLATRLRYIDTIISLIMILFSDVK